MATKEFITARIKSTEERITKLKQKLNRINTALNGGPNPYSYSDYDLRITNSDLQDAQKSLDKYRTQLVQANEKEASRNVPAITEFLNGWKARMTQYYTKGLTEYYNELSQVRKLADYHRTVRWPSPEYDAAKAEYEQASEQFHTHKYGEFKEFIYIDRYGRSHKDKRKVKEGMYEYLMPYHMERTLAEAQAKLEKDLQAEWERKYDFIIERTCAIVGKIVDASDLKVGAKGDLNGYIKGAKYIAKVQTIGAGGYNIQCFHFRTLINPYERKATTKPQPQPQDKTATSTPDFKGMTIEQLKTRLAELGGECKVYENEAIYRMRLIMAIKKAM